MDSRLKKKYVFDLRTGHYVRRINEEETQDNNTQSQAQTKPDAGQEQAPAEPPKQLVNIETAEVANMRQARDAKVKSLDSDIQKAQQQGNQLQAKYSEAVAAFNKAQADGTDFDISQVSQIHKQMLQLKVQVEEKTFEKAKAVHDANIAILQAQTKLLESFDMSKLPPKYRKLNESNMQAAKVYISVLVKPEFPESPMKGMVDVRRVFGISGLLYGKDKNGYFVICIDQEDFDKMYQTLIDNGYTRDEVIDAIMPQVFDRRKLIN